jgi:glycosyltransferase involved in cell wall biosynthesis
MASPSVPCRSPSANHSRDVRSATSRPTVVFLTANQTLPFDRRVWQECETVRRLGARVIGISPMGLRGRGLDRYERVDGIDLYRYPLNAATGGTADYLREFGGAVWQSRRLLQRLARHTKIDVVHAGNPPDFLLLAAIGLKRGGTRLIFDHHDLSPELYLVRAEQRDAPYHVLRALERLTFRAADVVIATNRSFRAVAIERGRKSEGDVFVVRNGPRLSRFTPVQPDPTLKGGKRFLLGYAGVMGQQDGLDHALRALAALRRRRDDWRAVFLGDGDVLPDMRLLASRLGLDDIVEFTGWMADEQVRRILSSSDVCLAPDPRNSVNDRSTMIKIMEYMALARPIVSFDLAESRFSAAEAGRYAQPNDVEEFALEIDRLLDDPDARAAMGAFGLRRVQHELAWEHSERELQRAYARVLGPSARDGSVL